ncbi:MAG: GGDEF domain-containing protein [Lentihominibacter sp.]
MGLIRNKTPYYVIMFDLNNLKFVNDNYGHDRGDKYLQDFSRGLDEVFANKQAISTRYGGDEFLVVMDTSSNNEVMAALDELELWMENLNKKSIDGIRVMYAYGTASHLEGETYDDVIAVADKRMYIHKSITKKRMTR